MAMRRLSRASGIVASVANAGSRRWLGLLTTSAVFGIPFCLFRNLILHHFYIQGGLLIDTGLLGSLMWHIAPSLPVPPWYGEGSFFAVHIAPLMLLASAASEALPFTMPQNFAVFVGMCHGLLALAIFALLASGGAVRHGPTLFLAALASIGFACTGLALAIALFPHFEMFGAACLLLSFAALARERWTAGAACFLLALLTREDVGLHAFVFLSLWAAANWRRNLPWRRNRWIVGFAFAGLSYSVLVLIGQHLVFPGQSTFVAVYVGNPPFAHLTWGLVATRLQGWAEMHTSSIALPALGVMAWAFLKRDPVVLFGYIACIPWAVLQLLSVREFSGMMLGYYAYPFIIAIAWPLVAGLIRPQQPAPSAIPWGPAVGVLALVALSLAPIGQVYNLAHIPLPRAMLFPPSSMQQLATDRAVAALAAAPPALGRLLVDDSIAALQPFSFRRRDVALLAHTRSNTVAYFQNGAFAASLGGRANLLHHYLVPGTEIRIDTDRSPDAMQGLAIPLEPSP
jgi:hypothetical protein